MLKSGQTLQNRYRVISTIGSGGMGTVYLAEDTRLPGRRWVLKEMSPSQVPVQDRTWAIGAFEQEAKILTNLQHPGVTVITDFFRDGGNLYLVMEYVHGQTLGQILSSSLGQRLPLPQALDVFDQLCQVLEYLHTQTPPVIFRDLKPGNVMLTPDGKIKLIDFGIARFFKPSQKQDTVKLGTPGYAAPEQYGGQGQSNARTDIYGLGVLLHQMLTGYDPTTGATFHLPPAESLNSQVLPGVSQAISRATRRDPQQRFSSVAHLRAAVMSHKVAPGASFPPASSSAAPLWLKIVVPAGIAAMLLLACAAIVFLLDRDSPPAPTPPSSTTTTSHTATLTKPTDTVIIISPEQAVREYYSAINERWYDVTWARLSTHFKDEFSCCTLEGTHDFEGYKKWWDSVEQVDVGTVTVIAQTDNTATVLAQLSYLLKENGNRIVDEKPYIRLVFDATTHTWLFNGKGASP